MRRYGALLGIGMVAVGLIALFGGVTGRATSLLGVIFGLVGLALISVEVWMAVAAQRRARLIATGIHGKATILAVRDSNITVNDNPMIALDLRVEIPGQPVFTRTIRHVISRLDDGDFRPGLTLSVVADPENLQGIVVDWNSAPVAGPDQRDPVTGQPSVVASSQLSHSELAALLRSTADRIEAGEATSATAMARGEIAQLLRTASRAAARAGDAPGRAATTAYPDAPPPSGEPSMPTMPMISPPSPPPAPDRGP
jgi:hypothetical protein